MIAAVGYNPESIRQIYLGPKVPIGIARKCEYYSTNLAPSYIPSSLFKPDGILSIPVEELAISPLVTPELLKSLSADLKNHMEGRVQLFLQQMLLVYKTKLCFDKYIKADLQVGQVSDNGPNYVGAHSGTLPTLRLAQDVPSDHSVSFAKDTFFYNSWNTTIYLPLLANQIDSKIDGSGFRLLSFDILNQVALGEMSPKQGLQNFLEALISTLESIGSQGVEEQIILEKYTKVAKRYLEKTETNGFIQRFCLLPKDSLVNEAFYSTVQQEMHRELRFDCERLAPTVIEDVELPETVDLREIRELFASKIREISKTMQSYTKLCLNADAVRIAMKRYFIYLNSLPLSQKNEETDRILQIKSRKTIENVRLSFPAMRVYLAAIEAIKSQTSDPQNMHVILLNLMAQFSLDCTLPPPVTNRAEVCDFITKKMEDGNLQLTKTSGEYVELCSQVEKVKDAAKALFQEIAVLSLSMRATELDKLFAVKPASIGCAGLSQKGVAYYLAVLKAIEEATGKKKIRNISQILGHLLVRLNA